MENRTPERLTIPIIGGGWISDGRLLLATAAPEALHIWSLP